MSLTTLPIINLDRDPSKDTRGYAALLTKPSEPFDIKLLESINKTELSPNIQVSTATAIIVDPADPYLVWVGESSKHAKPVLPGGKIEISDCVDPDQVKCALKCLVRELKEEVELTVDSGKLLGIASDPTRDVRMVAVSKLEGVVTSPPIDTNLKSTDLIKASYGCPDYIFLIHAKPEQLAPSTELEKLKRIDIRMLKQGALSAGHDVVLAQYRAMLDSKNLVFPASALSDFTADANRLFAA